MEKEWCPQKVGAGARRLVVGVMDSLNHGERPMSIPESDGGSEQAGRCGNICLLQTRGLELQNPADGVCIPAFTPEPVLCMGQASSMTIVVRHPHDCLILVVVMRSTGCTTCVTHVVIGM